MEAAPAPAPRIEVESLARYSIPIHALLPWILWGLSRLGTEVPVALFMAFHLVFPEVAVASYRYWRGQGIELLVLLAVNHAVTFVSAALAGGLASLL